jgi:hypothetical protein
MYQNKKIDSIVSNNNNYPTKFILKVIQATLVLIAPNILVYEITNKRPYIITDLTAYDTLTFTNGILQYDIRHMYLNNMQNQCLLGRKNDLTCNLNNIDSSIYNENKSTVTIYENNFNTMYNTAGVNSQKIAKDYDVYITIAEYVD